MTPDSPANPTEPVEPDRIRIEQGGREADAAKHTRTPPVAKGIGPYRILEVLGEGGMGTVYLAEQAQPLRRVALKVIKPGMDSKAVIARFEAEEQALALMNHPNVAQVFDAGTTEQGRPYFVMEHVAGSPITEHCDRHKLSIAARLELFMQVCEALQHAHQKGVIHRDIKPSNILVAFKDGQSVPKIIDFGVAKAIGYRLAEGTVFTQQGQLIGTPEYMSPEQAEMSAENVDTRTDIYSLGVLLYELLTGTLPFDRKSLHHAAFDEIRRIIREVEPPKPSTRISSMITGIDDHATLEADNRKADPRTLIRRLRGDLDWITMKALEKNRARRYASASDFAADIRRHLSHDPVVAGPPGTAYRVKKFVRRNRAAVASVAAVMLVLVIGTVASAWLAFRATKAEKLAERRLVDVRHEAAKSQAVLDFLRTMLTSASPEADGADVRVLEVLDEASRRLPESVADNPEIEAAVRSAIGETYLSLGRLDDAETHLRAALAIRERVLGEDHVDVARSLYFMAWLMKERGDLDRAASLYRRSLTIQRAKLGDDHVDVADTMHNLGVVLLAMGELEQAESLLRNALRLTRRLRGPNDPELATTMTLLGNVLRDRGQYDAAEELQRDALAIYRKVHGPDHVYVARALSNLASVIRAQGRLDEAESLVREAIEIRRAKYGPAHPAVASSLFELARIFIDNGEYDKAEPPLAEALAIYRDSKGESHPWVASATLESAAVHAGLGENEEADTEYRRAIDIFTTAHDPSHWLVADARGRYGVFLAQLRRYEEAERQLLAAHEVLHNRVPQRAGITADRLVTLYEAWGKDDRAALWRTRASVSRTFDAP